MRSRPASTGPPNSRLHLTASAYPEEVMSERRAAAAGEPQVRYTEPR